MARSLHYFHTSYLTYSELPFDTYFLLDFVWFDAKPKLLK